MSAVAAAVHEAIEQSEIRPQTGRQEQYLSSTADIAFYGGQAFGGKAVKIQTLIPTPTGWTTMGDLRAGDYVFGSDGRPTRVVQAHPITIPESCYRLTFSDGSQIDANGEHLWFTATYKDLDSQLRRTDEWRARRRASRPPNIGGKKSEAFSRAIAIRNANKAGPQKDPTFGSIKTTSEILRTLNHRKRNNHFVPVAGPLNLPRVELPIDPYLLGIWLGDGSSGTGVVSNGDPEMFESLAARKLAGPWGWRIEGLTQLLKANGLRNNKHIPAVYLRSSIEQRLALLQGLMDTDGTANKDGSVEFTNTNERLAAATLELVLSLGLRATLTQGKAMLNGRIIGDKYRIKWTAHIPMFRLARKLKRQKLIGIKKTKYRSIVAIEPIEPVPMRCITVDAPDGMFLAGKTFIPTHNSYALLLDPLHFIDIKGFGAVIFRRNATDLTQEGGLWDDAMKLYPHVGGRPREAQGRLDFRFPRGSRISFSHLQMEETVERKKGGQIAMIGFDEVTEFSERQFFYMLSRNRSQCGVRPYVRATCNPDPDSWVAGFLSWWICEETGYPISAPWWDRVAEKYRGVERSGVLRWMIRLDEQLKWFDSEEEAIAYQESLGWKPNKHKSVTFIAASRHDNPIGMEKDPAYEANLYMQNRVDRARLLDGNWKIRAKAGIVFKRSDFKIMELDEWARMQHEVVRTIRRWDFAGTEAKRASSPGRMSDKLLNDPDWTVGLKACLMKDRSIVFIDLVRDRLTPGKVKDLVKETAKQDGKKVTVIIPEDPGQAGKDQVENYQTNVLFGIAPMRSERESGSKLTRSEDYSSYAEHGHVYLLRASWNEVFLAEHDAFPSDGMKDDIVDVGSGAYRALTSKPMSTAEAMAAARANKRR